MPSVPGVTQEQSYFLWYLPPTFGLRSHLVARIRSQYQILFIGRTTKAASPVPGSHGLQINLCKCLLPSSQGCVISISNLICPKLNSSPNRIFNSSSTAILAFQILRPKPLEPSCFYCPHPILQKTCQLHFQKSLFMTTSTTPFYPSPNQDHHLPKLFP